jgi:hypothetical protein
LTKDVSFKGNDTGNGEAIVNGDLHKNGFNMTLHGFGFQFIGGLPYPESMFTPNTTLYQIEKAFDNPSNAKIIAELEVEIGLIRNLGLPRAAAI